jgi:osmoprotectant transport system substrate-binding protein
MLALVLAALLVASCGGGDDGDRQETTATVAHSGPPVRIGTKNFTEQFILGELYKQALEAKGFRVELKSDIGSSEITHQALAGGALDMYPEYVDLLLSEVANQRVRPRDPAQAYEAAKRFEERNGFTLLAPTPFKDANAIAVTPRFARAHKLRSIADLAKLARVRIGAPQEFRTRFEGFNGLQDIYRLTNLEHVVTPIGDQYAALDAGKIDAARVSTTDGELQQRKLVLLTDPKRIFAANHVAPVISDKAVRTHGAQMRAAIDGVSRVLTTADMQKMNAAVEIDKRTARDVAAEFLRAKGLVGS